ncbi:MAG: crAss001_48 related protein [Plesiomonas shigelloides]
MPTEMTSRPLALRWWELVRVEMMSNSSSYKERVVEEAVELEVKLSKLTAFMKTEAFTHLSDEDMMDLTRQENLMLGYLKCLKSRISRF